MAGIGGFREVSDVGKEIKKKEGIRGIEVPSEKSIEEIDKFWENLLKSQLSEGDSDSCKDVPENNLEKINDEYIKKPKDTSECPDTLRDMARTPASNGSWEGERGNSKWIPDGDYVPLEKSPEGKKPYSNPENKTWSELLQKYGIDGIRFKDGYPDFGPISKGNVEIEDFKTGGTEAKNANFVKADIELAKQKGCSPGEVEKWRKDNNFTWHECEDKKTVQKVPNEIHANISHDGGRSQN